jgi:Asp-tRNA(Asn)/Glu-tRNA(Gln) amidotransferase A subunit family amidase
VDATELCFTPATELRRLIDSGELSPVELTEAVLARIERLNPTLNAFLTVTANLAREEARAAEQRAGRGERLSPIDGIPYSIKDLEATAGIRTTMGSKFFEHNVPTQDGAVASKLRRSGGVLLGKTNTPNHGYKDMSDNLLGPPCQNPWKLGRTSGGSSGGAAAAIASGLGPLAHGSDGAGSIRIPSSLCGIFGIKPSFGRVAYAPSSDYWAARSHNGPMARTVRDAALFLQVLAGPNARDPLSIDSEPADYLAACDGDLKGVRVAWTSNLNNGDCDTEVAEIAGRAARRLAEASATVESIEVGWPNSYEFHKVIYVANVAARQVDRAEQRPEWVDVTLWRMILEAGRVSAIDHGKALLARGPFYEAVMETFETYDLLLTPQMPVGAWSAEAGSDEGAWINGKFAPSIFDRCPFTYPFNLTGQPAATVPCGFTAEGLPVGLQIVGRWHDEPTVFRAAACFEAIQPWAGRRPAVDGT